MEKLELTIPILKHSGLKCNIKKSFFGLTDMEYFSFWETINGTQRVNLKIESIVNMMTLNTKHHMRVCIV